MKKETLPVARIDLAFDDPGGMIRAAVLSLLPSISGNRAEMTANVEAVLAEVGDKPLTVSCAQTEDGVSIVFFKDEPKKEKSRLILPG